MERVGDCTPHTQADERCAIKWCEMVVVDERIQVWLNAQLIFRV